MKRTEEWNDNESETMKKESDIQCNMTMKAVKLERK